MPSRRLWTPEIAMLLQVCRSCTLRVMELMDHLQGRLPLAFLCLLDDLVKCLLCGFGQAAFFESTHSAAADLAGWDRDSLECASPEGPDWWRGRPHR